VTPGGGRVRITAGAWQDRYDGFSQGKRAGPIWSKERPSCMVEGFFPEKEKETYSDGEKTPIASAACGPH